MFRTAVAVPPPGAAAVAGPQPADRPQPVAGPQSVAGRWLIDASRSTLRVTVKLGLLVSVSGTFGDVCGAVDIAADPAASRVQVTVATASLSSGNARMDAVMHGAGVVDSTRNPIISFVSRALRPAGAAGGWWLDGLLATDSALLDVTLQMLDPVERQGELAFRASAELSSKEAVRLLSQPGIERVLGPTMRLDLTVVAARA